MTIYSCLYRSTYFFISFVVGIFLLCASLRASADDKPLKIGVILCLTGGCKQTGTHALNGLMLARDEINARGGILGRKLELVVEDSREVESPSHAVSAYRHLRLDPDISLFIGPSWSVGGLPVAPIAAREPVILMAPTIGLEAFNEAGSNIFNLWPHDSVATKALASFAINKGWKTAAIISNSNPWESQLARIFRDEYKRLGGKELEFFESASSDTTIFRSVAVKIRRSKPACVFMTNYSQLGLTGRALREFSVQLPMMTPLLEDPQIEIAQGTLDGIIFAMYEDSAEDFVKKYRAKFSISPDLGADTGYDTLYVYKDAIERSQSFDPKVLAPALLSTKLQGASGLIRFDSSGGVIKTPIFKRLHGDTRVRLSE